MRIYEILMWTNGSAEAHRTGPHLDLPSPSFENDPANLAHAFTRRGMVKSFWKLNRSEGQPRGPAPPDAEAELIPSGTLRPTTASRQNEPFETEPPPGLHRFVPFR
jgi:hypothetical protein